jgi:hypothetical protein
MIIVVPLSFRHKLNYHFFGQNFNKIKSFDRKPSFHDNELKLGESKHIRLFRNFDKFMFIILYSHYLLKISKLKTQGSKLKFQI